MDTIDTYETVRRIAAKAVYRVFRWDDEQLAEDIATDLLPKLPPAPYESWVYACAYRRCLNELKQRQRHTARLLEPSVSSDLDQLLDIEARLRGLSPRSLGILYFRLQGYDYADIATMAGCTPDAARISLTRDLQRLCQGSAGTLAG